MIKVKHTVSFPFQILNLNIISKVFQADYCKQQPELGRRTVSYEVVIEVHVDIRKSALKVKKFVIPMKRYRNAFQAYYVIHKT